MIVQLCVLTCREEKTTIVTTWRESTYTLFVHTYSSSLRRAGRRWPQSSQLHVFQACSGHQAHTHKRRERRKLPILHIIVSGEATKFMLLGDNLLELQVARPREPQELASFFIGQAVQQEGAVHIASRVDPLFLLLPVLCKHATRWCPLDQALAEGGCGGLRGLRHLDADKLCDVNGERV